MGRVLIVYGTGEGQTAAVANQIGSTLTETGHDVSILDIEDIDPDIDLAAYDAVLAGSSIHFETHHKGLKAFLEAHADILNERPTGCFQVSLSSAVDDSERNAEAARYIDDLLEQTGWQPDRIGLFGGALRYSKYGFLKRLMIKQIAKDATGDVDTSRDYEYTDWSEVTAFAADFASFLESRLAISDTVGEPSDEDT